MNFHDLGSLLAAEAGSLPSRTWRFSVASHTLKHQHFGEEEPRNTFPFPHSMHPPMIAFPEASRPKGREILKM